MKNIERMQGIFRNILTVIGNRNEYQPCEDGLAYLMKMKAEYVSKNELHENVQDLISVSGNVMRYAVQNENYALAEKMRELIFKMYVFDAQDWFDSFMIALEYDRKPRERFYIPRKKILKGHVETLQKLADGDIQELFLSQPPRTGKLLADSTPILTTQGWKKHGDLRVGDYVFSPDGKPTKVIHVYPKNHTTHTVRFTDGTEIKCHFRHEWKVFDHVNQRIVLRETQDLIGSVKSGERNRYYLLPKEPLKGVKVNLKVKPYTLGAWLGDGTNRAPSITGDKKDYAIVERIQKDGYKLRHTWINNFTGAYTYNFDMRTDLQKYDFCHSRKKCVKKIPEEYLYAPIEDRLELLAGLLDTDGTLVKKEHRYKFTTADEELKNSFISLIATFGWRTSVSECKPRTSTSGIVGKHTYYVISFNPTMHIPCVLERKQLFKFSRQRMLAIESIYESEPEQGNCIMVERDGMYLAGETLKPTHNTTLIIFFIVWLMGKYPQFPNLYVSYSAILTGKFYDGVQEILQDPHTYNWQKIFPDRILPNTNNGLSNAKDQTLSVDTKRHYPTLTCRSLYGTLNGACDVEGGILISDDLLSGIEEALNPDRLETAWGKVDNNMLSRAKQSTRILWIGTRWSTKDPIGRRMELLKTNDKFKNHKWADISIPALDENDESNFEYDYGVGFSTETYQQKRASFEQNGDIESWLAQYQQQPIDREGTVFNPNDMHFFDGSLPDLPCDWAFTTIDPAFGGGDFVAAPICKAYGDKVYVVDVIYTNEDKTISQPTIAAKAKEHGLTTLRVEANKTLESYVEGIEEELSKLNYKCNVEMVSAPTLVAKNIRIYEKKADIIQHFVFLESGKRSKDYEQFMQNVFSFKANGKNKHDDAPDSLAMASNMYQEILIPTVEIFDRLF